MKPIGQRFLMIYSGVLTAVFAVTVLSGFVISPKSMTLEQLDVRRINLREPDGTLRLIIADAAHAPGAFIRGKEYPRPDRRVAGMIFLNDEGTENGGLIFGGEKSKDGTKQSFGHLSFDAYEQDQMLVLDSEQQGRDKYSEFKINDYPDYSIEELIKLQESLKGQTKAQQDEAIRAYFKQHGGPVARLVMGRGLGDGHDDSVMLGLNDTQGRPRIVMKVASDGTPSLEMLDAQGKVVGELVPKS
jgi:hypothetical protein